MYKQDAYNLGTNWDLYSKWEKVKAHFESLEYHAYDISVNYLSGSGGVFPYFVASGKASPQTHAPQLWTGISAVNAWQFPDFPRVSCLGALCSINYAGTNQLTNSWIRQGRFEKLGIVVADFPGGALVDAIIQHNRPGPDVLEVYEDANWRYIIENQRGHGLRWRLYERQDQLLPYPAWLDCPLL